MFKWKRGLCRPPQAFYTKRMCLTVPRKVTKIEGDRAQLQDGRWVKTGSVENLQVGDMVLAQANLVVEKISKKQVKEMKEVVTDL